MAARSICRRFRHEDDPGDFLIIEILAIGSSGNPQDIRIRDDSKPEFND